MNPAAAGFFNTRKEDMPNPSEYPLPTIEPWPDYSERFDEETLAQMRGLADASPEEVAKRTEKLEEEFRGMSLGALAITADRVVDAYYEVKAETRAAKRTFMQLREQAKEQGRDMDEVTMPLHLMASHVDVYARALLLSLVDQTPKALHWPERGRSNPKDPEQKNPEDIALRLLKGVCVANGGNNRNLAQVGLAAMIELPERYR